METYALRPIGFIRSTLKTRREAPCQGAEGAPDVWLDVLPEFERAMKLDDGVVRYLITLFEHEVGAPPMTEEEMARAARQDEEDDED